MSALNLNFDLLKKRIQPTPDRVAVAQDMPGKVRKYLEDHEEFETASPHTRLGGSYARNTAIKNIKDVDIVVLAAPSWRGRPISEMIDTLHKALKGLPEALDDCGEVTVRKQRRSVNVYLEKHELSLDIVPALMTGSSIDHELEVPDREWDDWLFSHPFGYACILSELNGDNGGKVVPMIKLFKHWRDVQFPVKNRPKSYWLESMVVQQICRAWVTTANKGDGLLFADLCDALYGRFSVVEKRPEDTPYIPDGKLRNHVAWNWKRSAFETFMKRLDETRWWAREAVETDDAEYAVLLWQKVFGAEWFPTLTEVNEDCRKSGEQSAAGTLLVTYTGNVLGQRGTAPAVPSPPKRFYGE